MPNRIEPAVFDTSPLIFLDGLEYAEKLPALYQVFITPTIAQELEARPLKSGGGIPKLPWVLQQAPTPERLEEVHTELGADLGEETVIALALDLSALAVIDERRARAYAATVGLRLTGTLGILRRLHRLGFTARRLEEDVERLEAMGMRMAPALKREVFKRNGQ